MFSRLGKPYIGPSTTFSFNVPARKASGAITVEKGKGERIVVRDVVYHGGMCARCEGMGSVSDIDLSQLYDDSKSLSQGALTILGYTAEGWYMRTFEAIGIDTNKPIRTDSTDQEVVSVQGRRCDEHEDPGVRGTYVWQAPSEFALNSAGL
jgi:excinuclease UvrABC ATPase subunit